MTKVIPFTPRKIRKRKPQKAGHGNAAWPEAPEPAPERVGPGRDPGPEHVPWTELITPDARNRDKKGWWR